MQPAVLLEEGSGQCVSVPINQPLSPIENLPSLNSSLEISGSPFFSIPEMPQDKEQFEQGDSLAVSWSVFIPTVSQVVWGMLRNEQPNLKA